MKQPLFKPQTVAIALLFSISTSFAVAQTAVAPPSMETPGFRQIPPQALVATMRMNSMQEVVVNGTSMPVSPGATVRNAQNLFTNVTALSEPQTVRYLVNPQGMVQRVWILAPGESTNEALATSDAQQPDAFIGLLQTLLGLLF